MKITSIFGKGGEENAVKKVPLLLQTDVTELVLQVLLNSFGNWHPLSPK